MIHFSGTGTPFYKEESSFHVRIEIISYSYLNFEGHRSYAYEKKRVTPPKGEVAQNEAESIHKLFTKLIGYYCFCTKS